MKYILFEIIQTGATHRQGQFGARPVVHRFLAVHDTLASAHRQCQELARLGYVQEVPDGVADIYAQAASGKKTVAQLEEEKEPQND